MTKLILVRPVADSVDFPKPSAAPAFRLFQVCWANDSSRQALFTKAMQIGISTATAG